jgi:Holliday junction resolvase RusA-like endonuclease
MGDQAVDRQVPFVSLPFLPPTSNNIYVTGRKGVRFLSKEAKSFKADAIALIQTTCLSKITLLDRDSLYRVWYGVYFQHDDVYNKTFGTGKKGAAETRYKRVDVENRIKLVADALATAIGIDDSQFWEGGHTKLVTSGPSRIDIYLWPMPEEYFTT